MEKRFNFKNYKHVKNPYIIKYFKSAHFITMADSNTR